MPAAVSASSSPTQLFASILTAARAERSVHYATSTNLGSVRVSQVSDAGVAEGIQRITFRSGAKTGHVTVIVSADTAYIRGDTFTLINYMGFKAIPAAKYAGMWVLIPRTDHDFSTVAAGVRLSSTIDQLKLSGPLAKVPDTKINGQRVIGVRGKEPSTPGQTVVATLYARAAGSPLPVKEVVGQGNMRSTVTFSNWNEPIHLPTPTTAVPISTTGLE